MLAAPPTRDESPRAGRRSIRAAALSFALLLGCSPHGAHEGEARFPEGIAYPREVELVPRTPHLPTFPCGEQCHDAREPDPTPRTLSLFHSGRRLDHGPAIRWCDRCHSMVDADQLALFDGTTVSFDASDRICAQCHGEKHRDWSRGLHGLQTGGWTGTTQRRLCTACHDPHMPDRFELEALPPPVVRGRTEGGPT